MHVYAHTCTHKDVTFSLICVKILKLDFSLRFYTAKYMFVLIMSRQVTQYGLLARPSFVSYHLGDSSQGSPSDDLKSCFPLIPLSSFLTFSYNTRFPWEVALFSFILPQVTDVTYKNTIRHTSVLQTKRSGQVRHTWTGLGLSQGSQ